ncbi:hypothetical protein SCAR479_10785 [Seiridium cardinale]|uniref:Uncharacterized protein n=1 Tax=Seiridium cardinale TaxID=138064 RepID=A0ABR2XFI5_9PEZI
MEDWKIVVAALTPVTALLLLVICFLVYRNWTQIRQRDNELRIITQQLDERRSTARTSATEAQKANAEAQKANAQAQEALKKIGAAAIRHSRNQGEGSGRQSLAPSASVRGTRFGPAPSPPPEGPLPPTPTREGHGPVGSASPHHLHPAARPVSPSASHPAAHPAPIRSTIDETLIHPALRDAVGPSSPVAGAGSATVNSFTRGVTLTTTPEPHSSTPVASPARSSSAASK